MVERDEPAHDAERVPPGEVDGVVRAGRQRLPAALPSGMRAMTDSSPGWTTGMVAPVSPGRSSPPTSICHGRSA
jgi:hypothetical protein